MYPSENPPFVTVKYELHLKVELYSYLIGIQNITCKCLTAAFIQDLLIGLAIHFQRAKSNQKYIIHFISFFL